MTGVLPPTPAVLRSYRRSTYAAGGVIARVGRRPALPAEWSGRELVLLSAANPGGRRRPDGWNRRMMASLAEALRRVPCAPGEGRLGAWTEPLLLAAVAVPRGIVLARRFRQNAVVVLRDRRRATLVLLCGPPTLRG